MSIDYRDHTHMVLVSEYMAALAFDWARTTLSDDQWFYRYEVYNVEKDRYNTFVFTFANEVDAMYCLLTFGKI